MGCARAGGRGAQAWAGSGRLTRPLPGGPGPGISHAVRLSPQGSVLGLGMTTWGASPAHLASVQWGKARSGASPCGSQAPEESGSKGGSPLPKSPLPQPGNRGRRGSQALRTPRPRREALASQVSVRQGQRAASPSPAPRAACRCPARASPHRAGSAPRACYLPHLGSPVAGGKVTQHVTGACAIGSGTCRAPGVMLGEQQGRGAVSQSGSGDSEVQEGQVKRVSAR